MENIFSWTRIGNFSSSTLPHLLSETLDGEKSFDMTYILLCIPHPWGHLVSSEYFSIIGPTKFHIFRPKGNRRLAPILLLLIALPSLPIKRRVACRRRRRRWQFADNQSTRDFLQKLPALHRMKMRVGFLQKVFFSFFASKFRTFTGSFMTCLERCKTKILEKRTCCYLK